MFRVGFKNRLDVRILATVDLRLIFLVFTTPEIIAEDSLYLCDMFPSEFLNFAITVKISLFPCNAIIGVVQMDLERLVCSPGG